MKDRNDEVGGQVDKAQGEKLQKVLAQAGLGSRREMEEWIAAGRVTVNDEVAVLGLRVMEGDVIKTGKKTVFVKAHEEKALPRIMLYHKPEGEIVSRDDPQARASVFDKLPALRGSKWIAIGRLDYNTCGLLIFTNSGELANRLMHPRFAVEREYAVRTQGEMTPEQMKQMVNKGIELEDGWVKFNKLTDEGGEGFNHWYRLVVKEGRNRVVRRTFEALGLTISRLMRVRFGIINLPPSIKRGKMAELGSGEVKQVLDWAGLLHQPAENIEKPVRSARPEKDETFDAHDAEPVAGVQKPRGKTARTPDQQIAGKNRQGQGRPGTPFRKPAGTPNARGTRKKT